MGTRSPALSRESIVAAALRLLDEVGLEGLSTRRLADRLGVQSPALYWHFKSKQELLDAIGDEIVLGAGMGPPQGDESWQRWVQRRARTYRSELRRHRDGARIVAAKRGASPRVQSLFEQELDAMTSLGLTTDAAMRTIAVISHFVTGFVLSEQANAPSINVPDSAARTIERDPHGPADPRGEELFEHGLTAIILGTVALLSAPT